jgi:DNA recombination protein RmuC
MIDGPIIATIVVGALAALVGGLAGWITARRQMHPTIDFLTTQAAALRTSHSEEKIRMSSELAAAREGLERSQADIVDLKAARDSKEESIRQLTAEVAERRAREQSIEKNLADQMQMLAEAKEALGNQFKTLANDILEEKSRGFSERSQTTLEQLLSPLKTQISDFREKVEKIHVESGKERVALDVQIKDLVNLNRNLSADAQNLTLALKGQAKVQGNWGELILERVLEASGRRKGHEYVAQKSETREDGSRGQPDVVIALPEERKLVIDSKVSLVAYDRYVAATSDEEREKSIKLHLDSIRKHIRDLSDKNYPKLYGMQSMDFVVAFVPIEPAFLLAVSKDEDLFMDAWQRNVLLVSPSMLLFVVRTVAHLWRQEQQSRNAQEIARRGGELYDKLSGFVAEFTKIRTKLDEATGAYDSAFDKLSRGRGNAIRQAEMLRSLGVKPTKQLPQSMVAGVTDEELENCTDSETRVATPIIFSSDKGNA